ncbi:MAG: hypothetical protein KGJ58_01695 [Patescibacteria group bacterium]|nr:hypothetical protein [Patescibacteria group bacterium]MDE2218152.1 hypothetical protein [Patescibacteria group bacterium]
MKGQYPYKLLPRYPHMKPADVAIWERFIKKFPDEYNSVDYDVAVGTGRRHEGAADVAIVDGFEHLTRKKIDVVGYKEKSTHIIEVKPNAGASALGQAKSYELLYKRDIDQATPTLTRLITDTAGLDMPHLSSWMEVEVIEV